VSLQSTVLSDGGPAKDYCKLSMGPVNYFTGENIQSSTDFESPGYGGLTFTRYFSSDSSFFDGSMGPGWRQAYPRLIQSGNKILLIYGSRPARTFLDNGNGTYTADFFYGETLKTGPGGTLVLVDLDGGISYFNDFNNVVPQVRGRCTKHLTPWNGSDTNINTLFGYNGTDPNPALSGVLLNVHQLAYTGGGFSQFDGKNINFNFAYYTSGTFNGLLSTVTWQREDSSTITRVAELLYYATSGNNGPAGSLQRVNVRDASNNILETKYYRYNAVDGSGRVPLRFILDPRSYERAKAALGGDSGIDGATDPQLAPYADYKFLYDANMRVTEEDVNGAGTGIGVINFDPPVPSGNAQDLNNWDSKVVEHLPDGNRNIVYSNYVGQPLLSIFHDQAGNEWKTYKQYDASGRCTQEAMPSAVASYNDLVANLGVVLQTSTGLIRLTSYGTSTTATPTTPGDVTGYVKTRSVKPGSTGTVSLQETIAYLSHTMTTLNAGSLTIYPIGNRTVYRNTDGTGGQTTGFAYTWLTSDVGTTNQIESITTTYPTVTAAQNGPAVATLNVQFNDFFGRPIWFKDPDGFLRYTEYDTYSFGIVKSITDVDTTKTTDFFLKPTGWTTPTGGGLHLKTLLLVDKLARPTQVTDPLGDITWNVYNDPAWESRTYPGWTGTAPTGPTQVSRRDKPGSYDEMLTMSVAPHLDLSGNPDGTEGIASVITDTRTFLDTGNRLINRDSYFLIPATYTPSTIYGALATNFYRESYGYDSKGRQNHVVDWTGTIRDTVFDGLGRVSSTKIGTNDTGSPNMIQDMAYLYDEDKPGGIGDGNLTRSEFFTDATTHLDTQYVYDFRNRMIQSSRPDGVQVVLTLDNLGQQTMSQTYANGLVNPANLRGQVQNSFDEKGQLYQTIVHNVSPETDPSPGQVNNHLTTNVWSNARGMQVKVKGPNGQFQKTLYDGAGRTKATFICFDDSEANTDYPSALTVIAQTNPPTTADTVIEESVPSYDADSNVIQMTRYQRTSTTTVLGDLATSWSAAKSRRTFRASWFDKAIRQTDVVEYGDNGGSTFTRPTTPPAPNTSDNYLVTHYDFDTGGRQDRMTDNLGRVAKQVFDGLSRPTDVIENFSGSGNPVETDLASNRHLTLVYDTVGRLSQRTALNPKGLGQGVESQTTTYVYGTTANQATPPVFRNDILIAEIYPDSDDTPNPLGNGPDTVYDRIEYTYDYASRKLTMKDQRQTIHTYSYDTVGRFSADTVTALGTADGAVRRLGKGYDSLSRVNLETSYSDTGGTTKVNEVKHTFDGWGNEIKREEAHAGAVGGGTPSIQQAFAEGAVGQEAKYARLSSVTYPNARVVYFNYPAAGSTSIGDHLSRIDNIANDSTGTNQFAQYTYLGIKAFGRIDHPMVTNGLRRETATDGTPAEWDRLGRVLDERWKRSGATYAYDRNQYTYDRASNRVSKNMTSTTQPPTGQGKDEFYVMDNLNRLTKINRGVLASGQITDANAKFAQSWTALESQGDWRTRIEDTNGGGAGGSTTQSRTHNKANEVLTVTGDSTPWATPAYDLAGNLTTAPQPGAEPTANTLTYDAWNRLVKVQAGATELAEFQYDAGGRRIVKLKPNGSNWDRTDYYYNQRWQCVEERTLTNTASKTTVATVPHFQWVWCLRYIDAVVLRDENKDGDNSCTGGADQRLYYTQDANYNVTALVSTGGVEQERYIYDPYGKPYFFDAAWGTRTSSSFGNEILMAGYRRDPETALYHVRNRAYHPTLGRWAQRDPAHYHDSMNLYQYVKSGPIRMSDPTGLVCCVTDFTWDTDKTHKSQVRTMGKSFYQGRIGGIGPGSTIKDGKTVYYIFGGFDLIIHLTKESNTAHCKLKRTHLKGEAYMTAMGGLHQKDDEGGPNPDGPEESQSVQDVKRDEAAKKIYVYDAPGDTYEVASIDIAEYWRWSDFRFEVTDTVRNRTATFEYRYEHYFESGKMARPAMDINRGVSDSVWILEKSKVLNNP
jgi:RHS repeat-associated protein